MPLLKPPIDAVQSERRCRELLNEFTRNWFDGNTRDTPFGPQKFPDCEPLFGAAEPSSAKPVIHYVIADRRPDRDWVDGAIRIREACLLNVLIRVPTLGLSGNQADHLAGNAGDLLKMLFDAPSLRADLGRKGILHPRVLRPPVPQAFPAYQARFMVLGGTLTYDIPAA